jgi:hypothetical protein
METHPKPALKQCNVWGEPVFSVMAGGWFCEKSGCIGKVEDGETGAFEEKTDFNRQPY